MGSGSRFRLAILLGIAVLLSLAAGGIAVASGLRHQSHHVFRGKRSALSATEVRRLSSGARHRSIIIFRNQLTNVPARRANARVRASAFAVVQSSVRTELARVHATRVHSYQLIDAMSASISSAEVAHLKANPAVRAVVPDVLRTFAPLGGGAGPALSAATGANGPAGQQQVCPANPAQPIIEPEARDVMNVNAAEQIADGSGIKVGIVADGIDPNNPDLIRPNGQHVIFDYQDFSGYGTSAPTDGREAFLDAGTIASQANQTYDLSGFVNPAHPLPPGCNIKIKGIAPGASLAVMNLAGPNPGFFNSTIIQAIQWAVLHDHVNILNESIGGNPQPNTEDDPVALADQAAAAAGVTVVASSGDAGPFNTEGSPATTPGVIAVGGTTTYRVYRQTTRYGTQLVPGGWEDNNITALSSSGTTEFNPATVNVVAPGDRGWSLCSGDTTAFFGCADIDKGANPPPIWAAGGTSASAPETSGTAALVMEAYANAHGGALPSPALVERIIVSTADDLGAPADHQGAGLVNTLKAVQLAQSIGTGGGQGNTLLVDRPQLSATLDADQSRTFRVGVTNEASQPQTITPSLSGLPTTSSSDTGSVTLSSASPTFVDGEGHTDPYATHTFTVKPGTDYLNGDITWNGTAVTATAGANVEETLFDPQGRVAAYSLLGTGQSGFGHVEVRQPAAGTWTAVIFTVNSTAFPAYFGAVQFAYSTENFHSAGTVSSPLTLAPGQSGSVRVTVPAVQAGDESYRLHLGTGSADDGSIPIVVRSLVSLGSNGGSFSGRLTGGGDLSNLGQTFTYQFRMPRGQPELNLGVQLADPNYQLQGFLTDPNGEPLNIQSTAAFDANDNQLGFGPTMQFFRAKPSGGLWTLTLLVNGPVDGTHLSEPFQGTISFARPPVTATGIPHSRRAVLRRGRPVTATIQITNTGNSRKDFFVDPRLDRRVPQLLLGAGATNVPLPLSLSAQPKWLVPPGTNALAIAAQGNVPVTVEVSAANGDPDFEGPSFGNSSVATLHAPEVAPGFFFGLPEPLGPFGAGPITGATANLAALANTYVFDPAVSSSSGDVWALSVDPNAPYTPVSIGPGASGTVQITITPSGRRHRVVHGFIAVDTFNLTTLSGDEVQLIPYRYRIG
jgi:subtilisin family serine protease